jgi:enoyl-CoA hydratase
MAKVEVERRGPITVLTLNRPEVHNAIDGETARLLESAILGFRDDPRARALVVTGAGGRAFSSGADLTDGQGLFDPARETGSGPLRFSAIEAGKPTMAAVEGFCFAGGLELAVWCDFRIAGGGSQFGIVNRRWGVPLVDGATQRLTRIVGESNALYMIETGVRIDVRRAFEFGLVQEIVPRRRSLPRALELAERIAAYPQASLLADRSSTIAALGMPLREGLEVELRDGIPALRDEELVEGLRRFASGDRPDPPVPPS